jgi:hypothetical protein
MHPETLLYRVDFERPARFAAVYSEVQRLSLVNGRAVLTAQNRCFCDYLPAWRIARDAGTTPNFRGIIGGFPVCPSRPRVARDLQKILRRSTELAGL